MLPWRHQAGVTESRGQEGHADHRAHWQQGFRDAGRNPGDVGEEMPRKRQPPRLYFREDEATWVIRDGERTVRTGCGADDSRGAEEALQRYLAQKYTPAVREHNPAAIFVSEVLTAYGQEYAPTVADPARIGYAIAALAPWWDGKTLMQVRGATCRAYADYRRQSPRANMGNAKTPAKRAKTVSEGTIRRELGTLSAAIGYWHREHGPLESVPVVTMPPKPEPKPHVLDRSEMARLLAGALGWYRLSWSDIATRQVTWKWRRDHSCINRHTARFIVIGRYTANRPGTTMGLQWLPNTTGGWPDFRLDLLYRRGASDRAQTNKRRPSVRLGRAAMAHFRRWKVIDEREEMRHIINWRGGSISDIGKSFTTALDFAGLPADITPHVLRHTRVTWWVEAGLPIEEAAAAAGMTVQMVEEVYWHRSPHFQARAAEA